MIQYYSLNVKLSNLQLNKLISGIRKSTKVTLNLSSYLIGDSKDETNFPHKLLLADTQVLMLCKAVANNSSANIMFLETHLSKMLHIGWFFPVFKNMLKIAYQIAGFLGEPGENMKCTKSEIRYSKTFF